MPDTKAYNQFADPKARERLLLQYLPLVRLIAGRMAMGLPRSVDVNDLVSAGVIGLIDALNNFDPSRGVQFKTYSTVRIRGAILDELRALDWVPRSARARSREIERAISRLENRLSRAPTESEIAAEMGIPLEELQHALDDAGICTVLSLDEMIQLGGGEDRPVALVEAIEDPDQPDVQDEIEKEEMKGIILDLLDGLPEQERLVVALYYYEELTLKEIGQVMGLTESRISQIHTKVILALRARLKRRLVFD